MRENEGKTIKIITFLICITGALLLIAIFSGDFRIHTADPTSARYLLSAISQGLCAVFAFTFTITLIALQLVASKYTIRVFDFFFNKWTLGFMTAFIVTILYSFVVLSRIGSVPVSPVQIDTSLILAGLSLFLLIPYFIQTKEHLKPETLISKIKQDGIKSISECEENLENPQKREELEDEIEKNSVILRDIAIKGIKDLDSRTLRDSVSAIWDLVDKTFGPKKAEFSDIRSRGIIKPFDELIEVALYEGDFFARAIVDALGSIGWRALPESPELSEKAVFELSLIGRGTLPTPGTALEVAFELGSIGWRALPESPELSEKAVFELGLIGRGVLTSPPTPTMAREVADELGLIGREALPEKPEVTTKAVFELGSIIEKGLENKVKESPEIACNLFFIGAKALHEKKEGFASEIGERFVELNRLAGEKGFDNFFDEVFAIAGKEDETWKLQIPIEKFRELMEQFRELVERKVGSVNLKTS